MWFVLAMGATVPWGLNYSLNERIFQGRVSPVTLLALQAVAGALVFLAMGARGALKEDMVRLAGDSRTAWAMAAALVRGVAANYLISRSIQASNATLAGLVELTYPVFTVGFTWLLFGQNHLSPAVLAGGGLVLAGAMILGTAR